MTVEQLVEKLTAVGHAPVTLVRGGAYYRILGIRELDGALGLVTARVDPADVDPAGLVDWDGGE